MKHNAAIALALLLAAVVVGIRVVSPLQAEPPLEQKSVLAIAWGDGPDQVGLKEWAGEGWQGPGTFATDGSRFYVADELNGRLQVYEGQEHITSIPLPEGMAHIKQMRPVDGVLYCCFERSPAPGGLARIDLQVGAVELLDPASQVPGFSPPYALRTTAQGVAVRRCGPGLEPGGPTALVATFDREGKVVATSNQPAAAGDSGTWAVRPGPQPGSSVLVRYRGNGSGERRLELPERIDSRPVFLDWDDQHIVLVTKPPELVGQTAFYIDTYNLTQDSWARRLVTITDTEIPPSFSTGDMLQFADGTLYEMAFLEQGFVIRAYPVGN